MLLIPSFLIKKHLDINIIDLLKYWNLDDITCCLNNYARAFRNEHSHYESTDGINIDDRWNKSEYKLPSSTITGISTDVYAGDIVIFNKYYPCKDLLSKEKIKILKDAISSMQEEYEDTELFRLFQEANKDKVWQFEPCDYIRFYIDKDNKEEFISDIIKFIRFYRYRFLISFLFLRDYNNFIAEFTHPVWDKKQNRYTYETIISEEVDIDLFEGHSIDSHSYITVPLSPEYPFNLSLHDDTLTCKLSNNYIRTPLKHIGLPVIYAEKLKCFEDKVAIRDSGKAKYYRVNKEGILHAVFSIKDSINDSSRKYLLFDYLKENKVLVNKKNNKKLFVDCVLDYCGLIERDSKHETDNIRHAPKGLSLSNPEIEELYKLFEEVIRPMMYLKTIPKNKLTIPKN